MLGRGSPWCWCVNAAPLSCSLSTSNPAASRVQAGAPSPPVHLDQTSWCGSTNTVLAVVHPGSLVLDRLPRHQEAHERQAPAGQALEVLLRVLKREGPSYKRDPLALQPAQVVRPQASGQLRGPAEVDPSQKHPPVGSVFEPFSINPQLFPYRLMWTLGTTNQSKNEQKPVRRAANHENEPRSTAKKQQQVPASKTARICSG
eukprot:749999-Hanusia_phi.AAC.1